MQIAMTRPLFDWEALEDSPTIRSLRMFLASIPDGELLGSLREARGKGRNDYPVHVLWGVVVLSSALRHTSFEACLCELRRNRQLRELIGIETEQGVPKKWNVSRFLDVLGEEPHLSLLKSVFDRMAATLGDCVPGFGEQLAGDATALSARRKQNEENREAEKAQGLPQPSGGRKEYKDDQGRVTKAFEWFGYKLHLLVDVKHEVAVSYEVTSTKRGDGETLPEVLASAQENLPAERIKTLAYDKAADSNDVHKTLRRAGIKPLIQSRALWKEEPERLLPGHDGNSNIVYDEAGTLYCYDRVSDPPVRHRMSYTGYEKSRGTLKYRCPAAHEGWKCPSWDTCNANRPFGLTQRIKQELDPRRFPPIPRATKQFERLYKGRTAVERVNARLKIFWGADDGNISGARRFHAHVGVVMVVHIAFATLLAQTPRRGTLGKMQLGPIARALQAKITA